MPQVPQLVVVLLLTQAPLHGIWFAGHWHCPFTQLAPVAQTVPQAPQLLALVCVLTQVPGLPLPAPQTVGVPLGH